MPKKNQLLKENESQRTIATFQKNAIEHLKINVRKYNNIPLVDFRVWIQKPEDNSWIPLKKGFSLKVEQYADFRKAIDVLDAELEKSKATK